MDRRHFLGAFAAATTLAAGAASAKGRIERVGVQLYTLRDEMKKSVPATLARVAQTGFKEVEFGGYAGLAPALVRQALDNAGLAAPSAHIDHTLLGARFPEAVEAAHAIGHRYLVNAWIPEAQWGDLDAWKRTADAYNSAGELCRQAGIQFCHHNHHFEFTPVGGQVPYEILLTQCDPGLVKMEMDLCWMAVAGQDPLPYFRRYPGRFPMVHLKQLRKRPVRSVPGTGTLPIAGVIPHICDVGPGVVDFERVLAQRALAGIAHYFVEHDAPAKPFESIATSYRNVKRFAF
jgi:sugar phosphate isomerase/epimerase